MWVHGTTYNKTFNNIRRNNINSNLLNKIYQQQYIHYNQANDKKNK